MTPNKWMGAWTPNEWMGASTPNEWMGAWTPNEWMGACRTTCNLWLHISPLTRLESAPHILRPACYASHCANALRTHVRAVTQNRANKARPGQRNVFTIKQ